MKKLFTFFLCLVSGLLVAQQLNEPFGFPVRPGTKEWPSLKTEQERFSAMQIPIDILYKMSTEAIVATCLNHPTYLIYITSFDIQTGFDILESNFNGLKELENRNDAPKCLINIYQMVGEKGFTSEHKYLDEDTWTFKVAWLELLLAQDKIIQSLNINDKNELLAVTMQKFNMKLSSATSR